MRSTETRMFDIFTHMSITHTHVFKVLKSLLACTQVGIANALRTLTTCYKFTHKFLHALFYQE